MEQNTTVVEKTKHHHIINIINICVGHKAKAAVALIHSLSNT